MKKKLTELLRALQDDNKSSEQYFLALINMAEFCFFKGNLDQGIYYINEAYPLLKVTKNLNYQAQFWYAISWLYLEKGDYVMANEYIKTFFEITKDNKQYPIHLYSMNLRASVNFHLERFKDSYFWANECYKQSIKFFNTDISVSQAYGSNLAAESMITMARSYKANANYEKAKVSILKAIDILNTIFGNNDVDISQAVAHTLLGEIYTAQGQYKAAYDEYNFAEQYYIKMYKDKLSGVIEVSKLFADFVTLGVKMHDDMLVKKYLTKLVENFSYQHPTTKRIVSYLSKYQVNL